MTAVLLASVVVAGARLGPAALAVSIPAVLLQLTSTVLAARVVVESVGALVTDVFGLADFPPRGDGESIQVFDALLAPPYGEVSSM